MIAALALAAIPLLWTVVAFGLSVLGLVEDIPGRHRAGGAA